MNSFALRNLGSPEAYFQLLAFLFRCAGSCSLVVRSELSLGEKGKQFLAETVGDLNSVSSCSEWPGTKLFAGAASVYKFDLSPHFKQVFSPQAASQFDWIHPVYKRAAAATYIEMFVSVLEPLYEKDPSLKPPDWDHRQES
jgi:hypothetical protein